MMGRKKRSHRRGQSVADQGARGASQHPKGGEQPQAPLCRSLLGRPLRFHQFVSSSFPLPLLLIHFKGQWDYRSPLHCCFYSFINNWSPTAASFGRPSLFIGLV